MIICVCNNINSATIQSAIKDGANSVDAVRQQTGATNCCGKCKFKVNRLLNDHQTADVDYSDIACSG